MGIPMRVKESENKLVPETTTESQQVNGNCLLTDFGSLKLRIVQKVEN